jgi:glutathione S-transferase
MSARLYVVKISPPAGAARAMLALKRLPYRDVWLMPGLHPLLVRFAGFGGHTVPALSLDGHKVQGSTRISRFLDGIEPDPPLFPAEPKLRRRVEDAESWGERVLQPVPRRFFRHLMANRREARLWMATDVLGMPAPGAMAAAFLPIARVMAGRSHATEAQAQADLTALPRLLDRVDELIADGTIGEEAPNAADFQIFSTVRVLLEFEDLAHLLEGRPSVAPARRLFPSWPGPVPRLLT